MDHIGRSVAAWSLRYGSLLILLGLTGCGMSIFDAKGPVGAANVTILIDSLAIMLAIVLPTIAAALAFAWWFRASNVRARYLPDWEHSGQLELIVWAIPLLTITLLGGVAWTGSHELDPAVPLPSKEQPLTVQGVSPDWKWLFIYPDQHVASVNRLVIPAGIPIRFELTSASVMNVFFVPQLGSMIYTMNGMRTQLNLKADNPGTLFGLSAHFSGDGFSDMNFDVQALPPEAFQQWVTATRSGSGPALTSQSYNELAQQSINLAPFVYHEIEPNLFQRIVTRVLPPGPGPINETSPGASKRGEK